LAKTAAECADQTPVSLDADQVTLPPWERIARLYRSPADTTLTRMRRSIYIAVGAAIVSAVAYFMSTPNPYEKIAIELEDESTAAAIYLPIEPHGLALFVASDASPDSVKLVDEVVAVWPELWPKMRNYLDAEMKDYGVTAALGRDEFTGSLDRMSPGVYMGDQSDIMIRLEFDEPPVWDFFIRGSTIAHSQPVF
jgi:hypothetical protein